jgi:hypothetical protein
MFNKLLEKDNAPMIEVIVNGMKQVFWTFSHNTVNNTRFKNICIKHFLVNDYMKVDVSKAIIDGHYEYLYVLGVSISRQMINGKFKPRVYYSMTPLVHIKTESRKIFYLDNY